MTRKIPARLLAAASLLGCALAAHAQGSVTGNVTLSNFQIQVVDLTPGDGIAAGYTVTNTFAGAVAYGLGYFLDNTAGPAAPYSTNVYQDAGNQASITSSTGTVEGISLQSTATSVLGPVPERSAYATFLTTIALNPGTRLIVSADATASESGPLPHSPAVTTEARLTVSDLQGNPGSTAALTPPPGGSATERLTIRWDNTFAVGQGIQIRGLAQTGAIAAVPEPGESALMLGGLAILGAAALRRRAARRG